MPLSSTSLSHELSFQEDVREISAFSFERSVYSRYAPKKQTAKSFYLSFRLVTICTMIRALSSFFFLSLAYAGVLILVGLCVVIFTGTTVQLDRVIMEPSVKVFSSEKWLHEGRATEDDTVFAMFALKHGSF